MQEILTLERHIDHLTKEIEHHQQFSQQLEEERDQLGHQLQTFHGVTMNQEQNRTDLQRQIGQMENEKLQLLQQINEYQSRVG